MIETVRRSMMLGSSCRRHYLWLSQMYGACILIRFLAIHYLCNQEDSPEKLWFKSLHRALPAHMLVWTRLCSCRDWAARASWTITPARSAASRALYRELHRVLVSSISLTEYPNTGYISTRVSSLLPLGIPEKGTVSSA